MKCRITVLGGVSQGTVYELTDGTELVIGRGTDSDTAIDDVQMSRVHCRVTTDDQWATLTDAGSSSGTFVAGKLIESKLLKSGDILTVGKTELLFEDCEIVTRRDAATVKTDKVDSGFRVGNNAELSGTVILDYRLDEIIASGNNGMIYRAMDVKRDRVCAVKVMPPSFADDEEQRARFVRAMQTMMPVKHDHIVEIYNAGKTGEFCWIAMQFIDGGSLADVINDIGFDGMVDWRKVWQIGVQVTRALHEASKYKIVHRNLTPSNILRRKGDRSCLVGDLMFAKALEGSMSYQVTGLGQIIGDIPFLPPESTRADKLLDARSDIYSLGATLYALMTGRPPVEEGPMIDMIKRVREVIPIRPKEFQLSVDEFFQDTVMKMLSKRPEDRYSSPDELLRELHRIGTFNNLETDWSGWER
ncbi:MAG: protein kinase domain-containing protein [Pirellulales bacterium]|jgi:serine/threonine protein kinase